MESGIFLTQERFDRLLKKLEFAEQTVSSQSNVVGKRNVELKRILEENSRLKVRLDIARLKLKKMMGKI